MPVKRRALKIKLLAAVGLALAAMLDVLAGRFSIVETPAGPRLAIDGVPQNAIAFTRADEYATSLVCHSLPLYEYRYRLHTSLLPRCGVAYDSYELSDIVDPRVGDYSVYVLPNAFSLSDGEKAAIARLEAAGKRIVRIPEPIGVDELRARLATAGAHIYLDTGDVVFAGRGYLTVHASKAGTKRIKLPYPCDIKEIFGAVPERNGVTEFAEEMAFGETMVYAISQPWQETVWGKPCGDLR